MRIEITTPDHPKDDATVTIDLCSHCAKAFTEGKPLPEEIAEQYPTGTTGSTDVSHPPYEDDIYTCIFCGKRLTTDKDN